MDPKTAAISAALHSGWITALGILGGFLGGAAMAGAATSPTALVAYTKATWFGFAITQILCPAIRAAGAAKAASQ